MSQARTQRLQARRSATSQAPKAPIYAPKSKPKTSIPAPPPKPYELPAFSIAMKAKPPETELDKLRKKTIRRNAPPGENLKAIKDILRTTKHSNITVHEFIGLVAPSTGDQGRALSLVLDENLASFRTLAKKVYEMITQDNSDVLLNQQVQLAEYYKERKWILNEKMLRALDDIHQYAPNFSLRKYVARTDDYLNELFPIPADMIVEPEEIEMMKRQAAYHRIQWLRSEGERLNEENNSLKNRLRTMRNEYMTEQKKMADIQRQVTEKRDALEAKEAEKQETLDILNQSLEKSMIGGENLIRKKQDREALTPRPKTGAVPKQKKGPVPRKRTTNWNEEAALDIEARATDELKRGEGSKVSPRQVSPFHYSPNKFERESTEDEGAVGWDTYY